MISTSFHAKHPDPTIRLNPEAHVFWHDEGRDEEDLLIIVNVSHDDLPFLLNLNPKACLIHVADVLPDCAILPSWLLGTVQTGQNQGLIRYHACTWFKKGLHHESKTSPTAKQSTEADRQGAQYLQASPKHKASEEESVSPRSLAETRQRRQGSGSGIAANERRLIEHEAKALFEWSHMPENISLPARMVTRKARLFLRESCEQEPQFLFSHDWFPSRRGGEEIEPS